MPRPHRPRAPGSAALVVAALIGASLASACVARSDAAGPVVRVSPGDDVQALLDTLRGPAVVAFEAGDYHLRAVPFTDSTCGNCSDPEEDVPATRGLLLRGRGIALVGTAAHEVALHTHAGYGVLFDGCDSCSLARMTVTDGVRDPDGRATDAGVVVRRGRVTLTDCWIRDNLGDSAVVHSVVVGVMGVAVREQGHATVRGCRIERNSWDGIGAYRDARLLALDNVIDGVDKAAGSAMGGGRGVGIGLTWNARGVVRGNLVTRYWKGIGVFVDAQASISGNVVEDILTWGIAAWGPDGGRPVAWVARNAIFDTGACGAMVDRTAGYGPEVFTGERRDGMDALADDGPGELVQNVFWRTGQNARYDGGDPYCWQRPIARHHVLDGFTIADNLVYDVRQPGAVPAPEATVDEAAFREAVAPLVAQLSTSPTLAGSRFLGALGEGR